MQEARYIKCNILLTHKLLQGVAKSVSLHPVISFSVINYVVSMRCLTRVTRLIFFVPSRTNDCHVTIAPRNDLLHVILRSRIRTLGH